MTDVPSPDDPAAPASLATAAAAGDAPVTSQAAAQGPVRQFHHEGELREVLVIFLINVLFNLLTLTTFRFWAKTRVRRYIWSHTSFLGEALEYSGTGLQMFAGFLIALAILLPIVLTPAYLELFRPGADPMTAQTIEVGIYVLLYFLYWVAIYRARRYRLSRTQWRGVRGAMTGSAAAYSALNLIYLLLTWLTLGLFSPYANVKLWNYQLRHSWFGDRNFSFDGEGGALLPKLLVCVLLLIPTLGLSWAWYKAALFRYVAGQTRYRDLSFGFTAQGGDLLLLVIPNFLLMLGTLGLAYPYVLLRRVRFLCRHLQVSGSQDPARIGESHGPLPRYGEGMADFFGVGGI